jgi:hypothetical protein
MRLQNVRHQGEGQTIELFVNCRNKLIHEGEFRCIAEPDAVAAERNAAKTPLAEYLFIAGFVDRVILQMCGVYDSRRKSD